MVVYSSVTMETVMKMLEGILIGIVGGLVILYGLRPSEAYPKWMLAPYDHPWIFLVLLFTIGYITVYHRLLGGLLFLLVASLYIDLILFGRPTVFKRDKMHLGETNTSETSVGGRESGSAKWANIGIPLSDVNISEPNYPLLRGLGQPQPGDPAPADFLSGI